MFAGPRLGCSDWNQERQLAGSVEVRSSGKLRKVSENFGSLFSWSVTNLPQKFAKTT